MPETHWRIFLELEKIVVKAKTREIKVSELDKEWLKNLTPTILFCEIVENDGINLTLKVIE